jgi:hypothetical protein
MISPLKLAKLYLRGGCLAKALNNRKANKFSPLQAPLGSDGQMIAPKQLNTAFCIPRRNIETLMSFQLLALTTTRSYGRSRFTIEYAL